MLDTSNKEGLLNGLTMLTAMGGTVEFAVVFGVAVGYTELTGAELTDEAARDLVGAAWQRHATRFYRKQVKAGVEAPLLVSAAASNADAVYLQEWGCPIGGEQAIEMKGVCHPEFQGSSPEKIMQWWDAVQAIAERVRHELGQEDAWLQLKPVFSFVHLRANDGDN